MVIYALRDYMNAMRETILSDLNRMSISGQSENTDRRNHG